MSDRKEYERERHRRARRSQGLGSLNIQGVPLLRQRFAAACRLEGTTVERRLHALMEADIAAYQRGETE